MKKSFLNENKIIDLNLKIVEARTFNQKLTGLIFKRLRQNEIFLINNCQAIHTLWMRRPIDVIFLDRNNEVLGVFQNFKPFRFSPFFKFSSKVLEAETGFISNYKISCGCVLNI